MKRDRFEKGRRFIPPSTEHQMWQHNFIFFLSLAFQFNATL